MLAKNHIFNANTFMRKILVLLLILESGFCTGQTLNLQTKLFYTAKVWGYAKYYHSNVSTCHVNWDSVLIHVLPMVRSAPDDSTFNDALDTLLAAAGNMVIATTPPPTLLPPELSRNLNFGWFYDTLLRHDVRVQLDTIRNNFRPHSGCYVVLGTHLVFPLDSPLLNVNTNSTYPDSNHRQLMFIKYWNIINYFNPYNYVLDKPIDSLLYNNTIAIDTVSNSRALFMSIRKITAGLDDAHVGGATYNNPLSFSYWYIPNLMIRYVEHKYVVVKSASSSIHVGDAIVSVNGVTVAQMEDTMRSLVSAGNTAVFRRFMYKYLLLGGPYASACKIVFAHTSGAIDSANVVRNIYWGSTAVPEYFYPADSLSHISWTTMKCGTGYVNAGNMTVADADSAYIHLRNSPAIIIDSRNYPISQSMWELANLMYPNRQISALAAIPDVTYPGTFFWFNDSIGVSGNTLPYTGTIILLFNEQTQSWAEGNCQSFCGMPHVIKVGSQTAGAYGAVAECNFSKDIFSGFTSIGMYYPNGDSIQRIGIVPDSMVTPTIAGIVSGRDELLEKALEVACSIAGIPQNAPHTLSQFRILPNPNSGSFSLKGLVDGMDAGTLSLTVTNAVGQVVYTGTTAVKNNMVDASISMKNATPGMYLLRVSKEGATKVFRFIVD